MNNKCPKCGFISDILIDSEYCLKCGIIIAKYNEKLLKEVESKKKEVIEEKEVVENIIKDTVRTFKDIENKYGFSRDEECDIYRNVMSNILSKEARFDNNFVEICDIEKFEPISGDTGASHKIQTFVNNPPKDIIGRWYNVDSNFKTDSLQVYSFNDTGFFTGETYTGAAAYLYNPNQEIMKYGVVAKYEFMSKTAIYLNVSGIAAEVTKMFFNNINILNIKFIDINNVEINSRLFKRITSEYKKPDIAEWKCFWNEMKWTSNTYSETFKKNIEEGLSFYEDICKYVMINKYKLVESKSNIIKSLEKMQYTLKMMAIPYGILLQTDGIYDRLGDKLEINYNDRLLRVWVIVGKIKKYMES